jgi:uncharacterized protein
MRTLKGAGIILAGIVGAAAFIFLFAAYVFGLLWVSKNVLDYLNIAATIAFATCVFVLLPLSLFRVTRSFSAYGFYISSVIFGVSTWILGFLVTFQHWGAMGLILGVILGGVGIVPIGILASAFNSVWPQVGDLTLGLVVTFCARMIAVMLAQRVDRDQASIDSTPTSVSTSPTSCSPMPHAAEKWTEWKRLDRIKGQQIIMTALYVLVVGGLAVHEALHPSRSNYDYPQLVANLNAHPIASVSGALLPAVMFSPLVYWMFGWILRRNAARFKNCEHCAETIKAAAKVCRYCGRDVALARQLEVGARKRAEDEPGQREADVVSAMDQAQSHNPRLPLRVALVPASVLGLVLLLGVVVPWLADTHKTLVPASTKVTADQIEEADTAYRKGDYATALRLIRPLAEHGNAVSQTFLGAMYSNGDGVAQNSAEAAKWYRLAADRGNASAQYFLGIMSSNGKGVSRNDTEAVRWFRLAADQDNVAAQNNLGVAYEHGLGVPRNSAEAARWYRLAADGGFVDAQFNLGQMYFAGPIEMQNSVEAVKWFRRAADRGSANAQYFLGIMYSNGSGVTKDYFTAYIWTNLALAQGDSVVRDVAEKLRDLVEQSLTPARLAQAKKLLQSKSTDRANLLSDADIGVSSAAPAQKQSGQGGTPSTRR